MLGALEWNTGEGQTAHPRTTSDYKHKRTFKHTHARALFANAFKCFHVREGVCPCKGMCYSSLFYCPPPTPTHPSPNLLSDKREIDDRKWDHISQSQRCIGAIGIWQPAISHKHLPAGPVSCINTISSCNSGIDFRPTGVVIADVDVAVFAYPCVIRL